MGGSDRGEIDADSFAFYNRPASAANRTWWKGDSDSFFFGFVAHFLIWGVKYGWFLLGSVVSYRILGKSCQSS